MFRKGVLALCMLTLFSVVATDKEDSKNSKNPPKKGDSCECGISGDPNAIKEFEKIKSGKKVMIPNKYPWMVALILKHANIVKCGGSIISPFYVLTAAHCFPGVHFKSNRDYKTDYSVSYQAGQNLPSQNVEIEDLWIHEEFNMTKNFLNDIALIKVKKPFPCDDNTRPICLPRDVPALPDDQNLVQSGWGDTDLDNPKSPPVLLETTLKVENCATDWGKLKTHICANNPSNGPCIGDSGGPASAPVENKFYAFGLTSFGTPCDYQNPAAYSNVKYFLEWIDAHMQKQ